MAQINFGALQTPSMYDAVQSGYLNAQKMQENALILQQREQEQAQAQKKLNEAEYSKNALARAYQAAYSPETGAVNRKAVLNSLVSEGYGADVPAADKMLGESEMAALQRDRLFGENVTSRIGLARQELDLVNTPEAYMAWYTAKQKDPVLSQYFADRGVDLEKERQRIASQIQVPGAFQQMLIESKLGAEKALELQINAEAAQTKAAPSLADRYVAVGKQMFDRQTQQFISPPGGEGGAEDIKLEKGQVYNAEKDRVENKRGSKIDIETRAKYAKDSSALKSLELSTDSAMGKINAMLSDANKGGFEGNYGGINAIATREFTGGENVKVRNIIDSLDSDMKKAGLALMREGGSIGGMTQKEWPIVQGMIAQITPTMSEKDARAAWEGVRQYLTSLKTNAKDVYEEKWAGTQYADEKPGKPDDPFKGKKMSAEDTAMAAWLANPKTDKNSPKAQQVYKILSQRYGN